MKDGVVLLAKTLAVAVLVAALAYVIVDHEDDAVHPQVVAGPAEMREAWFARDGEDVFVDGRGCAVACERNVQGEFGGACRPINCD